MFAKPDHIYFLAERAARRLILQMGQRRLKARDRQDLGFRAMFRPPPYPGASTLPLFSPSSSSHKGVLWLLPFSDPLRGTPGLGVPGILHTFTEITAPRQGSQ